MEIKELKNLAKDIVSQADQLRSKYVNMSAPVNYACVFCQNNEEYDSLIETAGEMGRVVKETESGLLFQIEPLATIAGDLQLLKIRKADPTRPERGDADFTLADYQKFKEEHLGLKGFRLIDKGEFEMIELVNPDFNVRVYFSHPPLDRQLGIN